MGVGMTLMVSPETADAALRALRQGGCDAYVPVSYPPIHSDGDRRLDGWVAQPLLDDEVSDDLAVRGGLEDGAPALQLPAKGVGVGEVAVMGQGHAALVVAVSYTHLCPFTLI